MNDASRLRAWRAVPESNAAVRGLHDDTRPATPDATDHSLAALFFDLQLKPVPHLAFQQQGSLGVEPNQLILSVQPNEGVSLSLMAKIPGARMAVRPVNMEFLYGTSFLSQSPEAYERLITDAMRGDATLFTRNDEVEAQWRICDPILRAWEAMGGPLPAYQAGSHGPAEAEALLREGDHWRAL